MTVLQLPPLYMHACIRTCEQDLGRRGQAAEQLVAVLLRLRLRRAAGPTTGCGCRVACGRRLAMRVRIHVGDDDVEGAEARRQAGQGLPGHDVARNGGWARRGCAGEGQEACGKGEMRVSQSDYCRAGLRGGACGRSGQGGGGGCGTSCGHVEEAACWRQAALGARWLSGVCVQSTCLPASCCLMRAGRPADCLRCRGGQTGCVSSMPSPA